MKRPIICLFTILLYGVTQAQVGIGTATPDASAQLDVTANNKGLLIPRVALTGANDNSTIASPQTSLLVYNTASAGSGATAVSPGFYYWNGSSWTSFSGWSLTGNTGTVDGTNFIGTRDNVPLNFLVNNQTSGRIDPANFNTFLGYQAGKSNSGAQGNTSFGHQALTSNTTGYSNTANGYQALYSNVSGVCNDAYGQVALYLNTDGSRNSANGYYSMYNSNGSDNVAMGYWSLYNNVGGSFNCALGSNALYNGGGSNNCAVGYKALYYNQGSNNTALGYNAGPNSGTYNNSTAIGSNALIKASNEMSFGDINVNKWRFGGAAGSFGVFSVGTNSSNGNGAYLSSGGNWTNSSDSAKKDRVKPLDGKELLSRVMQLNVSQWYYKGTNESHIGPMAQQFYRLFKLGNDNKSISSIDPAGIALRVIQEQQKNITDLKNENVELRKKIDRIEQLLAKNGIK